MHWELHLAVFSSRSGLGSSHVSPAVPAFLNQLNVEQI